MENRSVSSFGVQPNNFSYQVVDITNGTQYDNSNKGDMLGTLDNLIDILSSTTNSVSDKELLTRRREGVRKSEQKRRKRLKERFEELREMLKLPSDRKITNEELLLEAIKYIRNTETNSNRSTPNSTPKTSPTTSPVPSSLSPLSVGHMFPVASPFTTSNKILYHTITVEEIISIFPSLELQIFLKHRQGMPITQFSQLQDETHQLFMMAKKTGKVDLQLRAAALQHICGSITKGPLDILEIESSMEMLQVLPEKELEVVSIQGKLVCVLLMMLGATARALLGRHDQSVQYWNRALKIAQDHPSTRTLLLATRGLFKYSRGDSWTLEEAEDAIKYTKYDPMLSHFGIISLGTALVECDDPLQQHEGLSMLEQLVAQYQHHSVMIIRTATAVLTGHLKVKSYERGLEYADYILSMIAMLNKPVFVVSEIQRLKALLLFGKMERDGNVDFPSLKEHLLSSVCAADSTGAVTFAIRSLIAYGDVVLRYGSDIELFEAINLLSARYEQSIVLSGSADLPPDLVRASEMLERMRSKCTKDELVSLMLEVFSE